MMLEKALIVRRSDLVSPPAETLADISAKQVGQMEEPLTSPRSDGGGAEGAFGGH